MHDHDHSHHSHNISSEQLNRAFYIGIALNFTIVIIEAIAGFFYHSLAFLSEAGHNLADVASLILSLFAFKLLKKKATEKFTYGYRRATILASLANAVILMVSVGFIIYEAVSRFVQPQHVDGKMVSAVAIIGVLVNGFSAFLFMKNQKHDLNVKGVYLHMLSDALVSFGVVVAGIVMYFTGWFWLDSLISIVIGVIILAGTWSLLTQSLNLSLDAVPNGIDPQKVREIILKIPGVEDFQHVHIWALSTTENALTAHIQVAENLSAQDIEVLKIEIKHELEHQNIHHSTIETYFGRKEFAADLL